MAPKTIVLPLDDPPKYLIVSRAQPKAERVYDTTKYLSSKAILVAFLDLVDTTLERRIEVNTMRVGKAG